MVTEIYLPLRQLNGDWKVNELHLPVLTVSDWWHSVMWYLLYFKFDIKRYNSQQYIFKTNLQIHIVLCWRFYNTLFYLLLVFFSPVFAFISFLNKDRLGIEISHCFEKINNIYYIFLQWRKNLIWCTRVVQKQI